MIEEKIKKSAKRGRSYQEQLKLGLRDEYGNPVDEDGNVLKVKRVMSMTLKVNILEWNFIRASAKQEGLSLSDYLRLRALQPKL